MRVNRWWTLMLMTVLLLASACTNDPLDDGDGADVVLQVLTLTNAPVTAVEDTEAMTCNLEVVDWNASLGNVALNEVASTSPFNDILMQSVTITYDWIDGVAATPTRTVGLGGVTVPVNGTQEVSFSPLAFQDLTAGIEGQTANLTLAFRGMTQEFEPITVTVTRQLFVEGCP